MKNLEKYSIGTGDRFGFSAPAQLKAVIDAGQQGESLSIVWNKSNREHSTIKSEPSETYKAGLNAVEELDWQGSYFFDADHINFDTVDRFIDSCDFFTIDVASSIGTAADEKQKQEFLEWAASYIDRDVRIGSDSTGKTIVIHIDSTAFSRITDAYLAAVLEAGRIYKKIYSVKSDAVFEISMDETPNAQSPEEMLVILLAISWQNIGVSTFAPKFTGDFYKGVDYVGDIHNFEWEFEQALQLMRYGTKELGLHEKLKLSVHSGSDKFSIYPVIKKLIRAYDAGLHLKTAGTSWLEELIALASSGGAALEFAKNLYEECLGRLEELSAPYADVIDISAEELPAAATVNSWDSEQFSRAAIHDMNDPLYNRSLRQLLHIGYKIAAERKAEYLQLLDNNKDKVFECVHGNILNRHIRAVFL